MNRLHFLPLSLIAGLSSLRGAERPPDIIFILAEDLGWSTPNPNCRTAL